MAKVLAAVLAVGAIACGGSSWSESERLGYMDFCQEIFLRSEAECQCSMEILEDEFDSFSEAITAEEANVSEGLEERLATCLADGADDG